MGRLARVSRFTVGEDMEDSGSQRDDPRTPLPIVPAQIRDSSASLPPWASPTPAPVMRAPGVICEVLDASSSGCTLELVLDARAVATRSRLSVQVDSTSNPTVSAILVSPSASVRGTCDPTTSALRFTVFGDGASKASLLIMSRRPVRMLVRSAEGLPVIGPLELTPDQTVAAVMWGD